MAWGTGIWGTFIWGSSDSYTTQEYVAVGAGLAHRINVSSVAVVLVPVVSSAWNQFDEHGLVLSLPRSPGEKNSAYSNRLRNVLSNTANSSYNGLVCGITRELGLDLFECINIIPKVDEGGAYLAADPLVVVDGIYIYLYYDYRAGGLELQINRYQPGGNYETLAKLAETINASRHFSSSLLDGIDSSTRSMVLLNQTSREVVDVEPVDRSTCFRLANYPIVRGSLWFSDRTNLKEEVASLSAVVSSGTYYVNYSTGLVTCYSLPALEASARYSYHLFPWRPVASPIVLHDIAGGSVRFEMFDTLPNGEVGGVPSSVGVDIINELLAVSPLYWE